MGQVDMTGKILVADDSPNIREILQMNLEGLGYSVMVAEDGEKAVRMIAETHPDLMVVDVMMPKVNGFQICRKVKSDPHTEDMPIILLTARSQEEDVFWGKDCGADEYITKPFSTKELERTVVRLMKLRQDQMAGRRAQIVALEWDPRAMDIFRKKYGEVKFSAALRALREESERFLEDHDDPGPVDVHETFGLSVVVSGTKKKALALGKELAGRLGDLAGTFYGDEDRTRGYIPFRDPRIGHEERLALLGISARIERPEAA
jgi:DNA-binding response OmpR family regulator